MTASDVNVVIDNIASKLGLAASNMSDFVPELARYMSHRTQQNCSVCMIDIICTCAGCAVVHQTEYLRYF